jgi:conjugative transfer signal peptidase TraF
MVERMSCAARELGDVLGNAWKRRMRLDKRVAAVGLLVAVLGSTIPLRPDPRLVWNASPSAPIGLYWVDQAQDLAAGDMGVARLPGPWRTLADERRYVPLRVPLVKRVAAAAGDSVCARAGVISINGRWAAARRRADARGRGMPWWEGCIVLRGGAVFLLAPDPASFDGRYFGPTAPSEVVGRARLLWAR